jgi:signal transduction histidine kinase
MTVPELLRTVTFFDGLSDSQLAELVRVGHTESLAADRTVFLEGDRADRLYVILRGDVRITRRDENGDTVELSQLGPGAFFGELALFDGGARSATVSTVTACEFFVLGRERFVDLLSQSPQLLSDVLAGISGKIRAANERLHSEWLAKKMVRAEMEIQRHRSIAEMVAGVAHEINTPLGIVNTAASFLSERLTPQFQAGLAADETTRATLDEIREACRLIEANIARANQLIRSFKSLSVSQITDARETVDLRRLVREIVDLFRISARRSGIQIEIRDRLPPEDGAQWDGYPGYFSQVLLNLLSNVERYAYPGGRGGLVEIDFECESAAGDWFRLTVRDFGRGIAPDHLPRLFEPFFTTGRAQGGTGLGLAIVHNLVTAALRGSIAVESKLGHGTCVVLRLRRRCAQNEP